MSRLTIDSREPRRAVPDPDSGTRDPVREPERSAPERAERSRPCMAREEVPLGRREPANRDFDQWGPYWLASDSVGALRMIGAFPGAACDDLASLFQTRNRCQRALADLEASDLIGIETFWRGDTKLRIASLTRRGLMLLNRSIDPRDRSDERAQIYRAGPAHDNRILHDAAVYRAAQIEIDALAERGANVYRVRTGDDLHSLVRRRTTRARRPGQDMREARAAICADLDLVERDGRFVIPDVRIEYRDPDGGSGSSGTETIDIEVTTPTYSASKMRTKAGAGFRCYHMQADGSLAAESNGRDSGPTR